MKKKLIILSLLILSGSMLLAAFLALNDNQASVSQHDPMIGKPVSHLKGVNLENEPVRIENRLGEFTLLNVWASWCSVCKQEHDYLLELATAHDISILGVNYRDDKSAAIETLNQMGNPYSEVLFDPQGQLALELGVVGTPETFLIDGRGTIVQRFRGALNEHEWTMHFEPLLEN